MKEETQKLINCMEPGNDRAYSLWVDICLKQEDEYSKWVNELRLLDIKMAHPDDGWVDREINEFHPCYPEFNDNPQVGDKIALGNPSKYRIVEVTEIRDISLLGKMRYYKFKEIESSKKGQTIALREAKMPIIYKLCICLLLGYAWGQAAIFIIGG